MHTLFVMHHFLSFLPKSKGMVPFLSVADSAFPAAKILVKSTLLLTGIRSTNYSSEYWRVLHYMSILSIGGCYVYGFSAHKLMPFQLEGI